MDTIPVRVIIISRHITAFISFLPTNSKHIFPAFEKRFEDLDLGGERVIHLKVSDIDSGFKD
jgi:hypothetical protein